MKTCLVQLSDRVRLHVPADTSQDLFHLDLSQQNSQKIPKPAHILCSHPSTTTRSTSGEHCTPTYNPLTATSRCLFVAS